MSEALKINEERTRLVSAVAPFRTDSRFSEFVLRHGLPSDTGRWTVKQLTAALKFLTPSPTKENRTMTTNAPTTRVFLIAVAAGALSAPSISVFTDRPSADEAAKSVEEGKQVFIVENEADMENLSNETLLAIFNRTRKTAATKFASPEIAREASFKALHSITPDNLTAEKGGKAKGTKAKAPAAPKAPRSISKEPREAKDIHAVRAGTKVAGVIDLIARPGGATIKEIEDFIASIGQKGSGPAVLAFSVNTNAGYGYRTLENGNIGIVLPKGMDAPHPHRVKEEPKPKAAPKAPAASQTAPETTTQAETQTTGDQAAGATQGEPAALTVADGGKAAAKTARRPGGKKPEPTKAAPAKAATKTGKKR